MEHLALWTEVLQALLNDRSSKAQVGKATPLRLGFQRVQTVWKLAFAKPGIDTPAVNGSKVSQGRRSPTNLSLIFCNRSEWPSLRKSLIYPI